jgi:PhzF family phenazine biosynthesis protein
MQAVDAELSLSETCFLHPLPQKRWSLRWFTPIHEVALCGHATLAASHLLWEEGYLAEIDQACFETRSGQVVASRRGEEIELDFPIVPVAAAQEPLRLERILGGVAYRFVGQTQHETERETNYLVELQNEGDVRALEVDLKALASLPAGGLIITARSENRNFDFVSRYLAPIFGIPEDPVTGSAHCTLGPFWRDLLGKDELRPPSLATSGRAERSCSRAANLSRRTRDHGNPWLPKPGGQRLKPWSGFSCSRL